VQDPAARRPQNDELPLRHTLRQQRTIAQAAEVVGFGYWSSQDVRVEFRPAPAGSGIVFVRDDLSPERRIAASIENRIETPRRTTLAAGGAVVEMVEHIMAALWGLSIDNCEVHVDACEMPGCDGSSLAYVGVLLGAGIVEQDAVKSQLLVTETIRVGDEDAWVSASPARDGLHIKYRLDYGSHTPIGRQTLKVSVTPESFVRELASARTFVLEQEAQWLREQGLGVRATYEDLLVFGKNGQLQNELRFRDECVRHKTLDLLGDLALAGCPVVGQITAHRSGHRLNAELVRALLSEGQILQPLHKSA
jgi:UDP-3-O-acyl N-acetylglucosamine deacetylase